jgi:hypothetical protein
MVGAHAAGVEGGPWLDRWLLLGEIALGARGPRGQGLVSMAAVSIA